MDIKIKHVIENNPIAVSTITDDNKPNVIAVAYVKVVSENELVITDNYMSKTVDDIKTNTDVCLAVWDSEWNGYKIIGKAEYHNSGKWLDFVKNMKENEGCPAKGAIVVKIEQIKDLS